MTNPTTINKAIEFFYIINNDRDYIKKLKIEKSKDQNYDEFRKASYKDFNQPNSPLNSRCNYKYAKNEDDFFLNNENYNQLMYGLLGKILQSPGENKEMKEIQEKIISQSCGGQNLPFYALNSKFVTPEFILSLGDYFSQSSDLSEENKRFRRVPLYDVYRAKNNLLSDQQKLEFLSKFKLSEWDGILNAGHVKHIERPGYDFSEFLTEYLYLDWNSGNFRQVDWKKYFSTPCREIDERYGEQLRDRIVAVRQFVEKAHSEEKEKPSDKEYCGRVCQDS